LQYSSSFPLVDSERPIFFKTIKRAKGLKSVERVSRLVDPTTALFFASETICPSVEAYTFQLSLEQPPLATHDNRASHNRRVDPTCVAYHVGARMTILSFRSQTMQTPYSGFWSQVRSRFNQIQSRTHPHPVFAFAKSCWVQLVLVSHFIVTNVYTAPLLISKMMIYDAASL
jgi:hypothetical protein